MEWIHCQPYEKYFALSVRHPVLNQMVGIIS